MPNTKLGSCSLGSISLPSQKVQDLLSHSQKKTFSERALFAYERMVKARLVDEKMAKMIRQNKGGTFHLSTKGHEMIGVLSALSLKKGKDWAFPYYRDRSFAIGFDLCLVELFGSLLAKDIPHHSGGRMMPDHFSHKAFKIPCQSSCVGSQFLQAVGVAKGIQLRGEDEVVYVSSGEGATSQGDFHEALNFSCIHKLPIVFVVQDNGWAISVPKEEQTAGQEIAKIARGYENLSVFSVEGYSYASCKEGLDLAFEKARRKEGPSVVIAKVGRLGPHSSSDDPKKYKTQIDLLEDEKKDPLISMETFLLEEGILTKEEQAILWEKVEKEVEEAARRADLLPNPKKEEAADRVLAPVSLEEVEEEMSETVVMMDALNHALKEEMEEDPGILVFGQDVARGKGGVFGITHHLTELFGKERCFNTPLAESTIVGLAIGLSLDGVHRPVAEIQFCDYSWTGMNQIINELASFYYRSNGEWNCPLVIRMPYGGYIQGGPYHSQCIESYLCHTPGLKVVIPSNAKDAKGLLKAAMKDPNPVIFLEHKALYRQRAFSARKELTKESIIPLGKANIVREGEDITIISWGLTLMMVDKVAEKLQEEGIFCEVIDLRTVAPLDFTTIFTSLQKTGKVLIVQEAPKTGGFAAEISAQIMEKGFSYLDAPVVRLGAQDCVVPYAKNLEEAVLPQVEDILEKARELYLF